MIATCVNRAITQISSKKQVTNANISSLSRRIFPLLFTKNILPNVKIMLYMILEYKGIHSMILPICTQAIPLIYIYIYIKIMGALAILQHLYSVHHTESCNEKNIRSANCLFPRVHKVGNWLLTQLYTNADVMFALADFTRFENRFPWLWSSK